MSAREFFKNVFREGEGKANLVLPNFEGKPTNQFWFEYPAQLEEMVEFVETNQGLDVWYSPILYSEERRSIQTAKTVQVLAADADSCEPENFRMQPTDVIQTSPGSWQVYWALHEQIDPREAAVVNRRIAQTHKAEGCDTAFVNAAKLMRVPGTSNSKHPGAVVYRADFDENLEYSFENVSANIYTEQEVPDGLRVTATTMPDDLGEYIDKNRQALLVGMPNSQNIRDMLFGKFSPEKRSEVLYKLCCDLFRIGMEAKDVAAIAWGAPANKFREDDPRGLQGLWETAVSRAEVDVAREAAETEDEYDQPIGGAVESKPKPAAKVKKPTTFLTDEEYEQIQHKPTFIDEWTTWASEKTDAPPGYHRMTAIMVMSSIYSEFGYVRAKFGNLKLNIWMLLLGRSTKDRKSTAANYGKKMLRDLENDEYSYIIPDDATPGGLNVVLQEREHKSSLFLRDEVQGFFSEMLNQSYMSGGISYFTKLYDGESGGRARASADKKAAPSVPITFQMFMLGILTDSADALTIGNYKQGFLTRFLYCIESRPADYVTPPFEFPDDDETEETDTVRKALMLRLARNRQFWGIKRGAPGKHFKMNLEKDAQERFAKFVADTEKEANANKLGEIIESTTERMSISVLKLSALIAMDERATRITLEHLLQAIKYAGYWFDNSVEVAQMISESDWQRDIDKLEKFINGKGGKVSYTIAYRAFPEKRPYEFEEMLQALESRGTLKRKQQGSRWMLEITYED